MGSSSLQAMDYQISVFSIRGLYTIPNASVKTPPGHSHVIAVIFPSGHPEPNARCKTTAGKQKKMHPNLPNLM